MADPKIPLQTSSAWSHLQTLKAAVERVKSWPKWKRELTLWRGARAFANLIEECQKKLADSSPKAEPFDPTTKEELRAGWAEAMKTIEALHERIKELERAQ